MTFQQDLELLAPEFEVVETTYQMQIKTVEDAAPKPALGDVYLLLAVDKVPELVHVLQYSDTLSLNPSARAGIPDNSFVNPLGRFGKNFLASE